MSEQSRVYFSDFYISSKLYPSNTYRNFLKVMGEPFPSQVPSPNVVDEKHLDRLRNVDVSWVNKALFLLHEKDNLPVGWETEALLVFQRPVIIIRENLSVRLQEYSIPKYFDYANIGRHRHPFEHATFSKVGRGIAGYAL